MTGRSDSDKIDPDRGNTSGRLLFGAALIFAVGATLTLVFATNAQWLKLAVIAALWAAFFGAMLSVKYRHQAAARAGEVADLQAVYELELEREVAARREYELEVEADTRRRLAKENGESSREDIAALRSELCALRENLERLTGGEVLVERFALRAQSTRMRSISEPLSARAIAAHEDMQRSISAGPISGGPVSAGPAGPPSVRMPGRAPSRPMPAPVPTVVDQSTELFEPAPAPRAPRPDTARRVGPQRPDGQRPDAQRPDAQRPSGPRPRRDESTGQRRSDPIRVPTQPTGEQSRTNIHQLSGPPTGGQQSISALLGHQRTGNQQSGYRQPANYQPENQQSGYRQPANQRPANEQSGYRQPASYQPANRQPANHRSEYPVDPASVPTRFAAPVARPAEPAADNGYDEFEPTGRHGSGSYQPVPRPVVAEPAGAHAAGRSVTELLAAHSAAEDSPRRHRRRAD